MTKIKICGIRTPAEAEYLNRYPVDYAGIVLYEKSKRYVPFEKIRDIFEKLNQDIIKIAVAVSPDENMIRRAAQEGFDVLQIHGDYDRRLFQKKPDQLKLWRAVNVDNVCYSLTGRKQKHLMPFCWMLKILAVVRLLAGILYRIRISESG